MLLIVDFVGKFEKPRREGVLDSRDFTEAMVCSARFGIAIIFQHFVTRTT